MSPPSGLGSPLVPSSLTGPGPGGGRGLRYSLCPCDASAPLSRPLPIFGVSDSCHCPRHCGHEPPAQLLRVLARCPGHTADRSHAARHTQPQALDTRPAELAAGCAQHVLLTKDEAASVTLCLQEGLRSPGTEVWSGFWTCWWLPLCGGTSSGCQEPRVPPRGPSHNQ